MATWSINPENQGATIDNNGVFTVEANLASVKRSWKIIYTDDKGNSASKTIEQEPLEYVEIGGIKWAKKNLGATSITDSGKYFQWADISGYTKSQIENGDKIFECSTYKYSSNGDDCSASSMTKYNSSDGIVAIGLWDDPVTHSFRGDWRTPTAGQWQILKDWTTSAWTSNYEGSGVAGMTLTDKTDNSKKLFFPACGYATNNNISTINTIGRYWSASLDTSAVDNAICYNFSTNGFIRESFSREWGLCIRPVEYNNNGHDYVDLGLPSGTLWATENIGYRGGGDFGYYYRYGKGADEYAIGQSNYDGIENPLAASADTATVLWGGSWHTPTSAQCQELIDNTTQEIVGLPNRFDAFKFTASNGNYVILPAFMDDGYGYGNLMRSHVMWTSTPYDAEKAYLFYISMPPWIEFIIWSIGVDEATRGYGNYIRPVMGW